MNTVPNSPVSNRLPSLKALRAFDAACRTGSFTLAAVELSLTQSAISRHIRNLESDLQIQLFKRVGRDISLTSEGKELQKVVGGAFEQLSSGINSMRRKSRRSKLTVSLLPSLAAKWLAPRIGVFASMAPNVELNIHCSKALSDFKADGVDVAIRYGQGNWAGCNSELLRQESITPVCAPLWLEKIGENPNLEELKSLPLLQGDIPEQWEDWLKLVGVSCDDEINSVLMTDGNALIQAAIEGQGVILGRSLLVSRDIAEGRLVAPFKVSTQATYSYWLVTDENTTYSPTMTLFRTFLMSEVERESKNTCDKACLDVS